MKKLNLKGKEIRLLLKVDNSGLGFYSPITKILTNNMNLADQQEINIGVKDEESEDMIKMIMIYINNNPEDNNIDGLLFIIEKINQ